MSEARRHWWRRWPGLVLRWTVLVPTGVYLLYAGALYMLQDSMIFPAPDISEADLDAWAERVGATAMRVPSAGGGHTYGWHLPGDGEHVVAYFHGNGDTVVGATELARAVPEGWDVVAFSYHGYPGGTGSPSEANLRLGAEAAWSHLTDTMGFAPDRVVLHGRSLGGSVAAMIAEEHAPGALVLESTFLSMERMASERQPLAPVSLLLRHPLHTDERLQGYDRSPVLVVHSTDDDLIPVVHGRGLAELVDGSRYVERPGYGHNDWVILADEDARRAYLELLSSVR